MEQNEALHLPPTEGRPDDVSENSLGKAQKHIDFVEERSREVGDVHAIHLADALNHIVAHLKGMAAELNPPTADDLNEMTNDELLWNVESRVEALEKGIRV